MADLGIGEIALAATAVSGAVGAVGAANSAAAQKQALDYQAQVSSNNATVANQNAALAMAAGEQKTAAQGLQTRAQVGGIKAAQAASGIDVNSGSATDVRSSASQLGELNQLTTKSNAARTAYGYETQGAGFTANAGADVTAGENAQTAGNVGAFSSVIGAASSVGSQYATWQLLGGGNSSGNPLGLTVNSQPTMAHI